MKNTTPALNDRAAKTARTSPEPTNWTRAVEQLLTADEQTYFRAVMPKLSLDQRERVQTLTLDEAVRHLRMEMGGPAVLTTRKEP